MLYLDQKRNRLLFMAVSILATVALVALIMPGINVVGIFMAVATLNILVYYALPDKYSQAYMNKYHRRFN